MSPPSVWSTPVSEAIKRSERRFLTASFLPLGIYITLLGIVAVSATGSQQSVTAWWQSWGLTEKGIALVAALSINWFLASLLAANWRKVVRLYEGYFLKRIARRMTPHTWSRLPGFAYHLHRQINTDATTAYLRYPPEPYIEDTLPTTIGNIMLSAERYGDDRYDFDTALLWPRLYWQLPDDVKNSIDIFKEEHQVPIVLSFLSAVFAVTSGGVVLLAEGSWKLFAITFGLGWFASAATYILSVERTEEYAEQIRTVTDLYRRRLAAAWHDGPRNWESDATFFARASDFVIHGHETRESDSEARSALGAMGAALRTYLGRLRHIIGKNDGNAPEQDPEFSYPETPKLLRPRLLVLAIAAGLVVTAGGSGYLIEKGHGTAELPAYVGTVSLPLFPASSGQDLDEGEVIDVLLRPCGVTLTSIPLERVDADANDPSVSTVTFPVTGSERRAIAGCGVHDVVVVRR